MYSDWVWLLLLAVFVWIGVLTFFIWQQRKFLELLFPKSGDRDIRKKFEEVINSVVEFRRYTEKIDQKLEGLEDDGLKHIQRIELLRFNPYGDTGGDQSFAVALLNKKGSGFILTSLHARSGTRVFAKPIIEGKSAKYQLSLEEEDVLKKALEK